MVQFSVSLNKFKVAFLHGLAIFSPLLISHVYMQVLRSSVGVGVNSLLPEFVEIIAGKYPWGKAKAERRISSRWGRSLLGWATAPEISKSWLKDGLLDKKHTKMLTISRSKLWYQGPKAWLGHGKCHVKAPLAKYPSITPYQNRKRLNNGNS